MVSTTPGTPAIARARQAGIPTVELDARGVPDGDDLDQRLLEALAPIPM